MFNALYKKQIIQILQQHGDSTAEDVYQILRSRGTTAIELKQVVEILESLASPDNGHEIHKATIYYLA